jgi:hypothetical protein
LRKIKILDNKAELRGLVRRIGGERYKFEGQLEDIFAYEEHVWQQRSSEHWLLEGGVLILVFSQLCKW